MRRAKSFQTWACRRTPCTITRAGAPALPQSRWCSRRGPRWTKWLLGCAVDTGGSLPHCSLARPARREVSSLGPAANNKGRQGRPLLLVALLPYCLVALPLVALRLERGPPGEIGLLNRDHRPAARLARLVHGTPGGPTESRTRRSPTECGRVACLFRGAGSADRKSTRLN